MMMSTRTFIRPSTTALTDAIRHGRRHYQGSSIPIASPVPKSTTIRSIIIAPTSNFGDATSPTEATIRHRSRIYHSYHYYHRLPDYNHDRRLLQLPHRPRRVAGQLAAAVRRSQSTVASILQSHDETNTTISISTSRTSFESSDSTTDITKDNLEITSEQSIVADTTTTNDKIINEEKCYSDILFHACATKRRIKLNKRQRRLEPWRMALLIHRYDRGIRDRDELNRDNAYYRNESVGNWGVSSSTSVGNSSSGIDIGSMGSNSEVDEDSNNNNNSNNTIAGCMYDNTLLGSRSKPKPYIDLRQTLMPKKHEIQSFVHSLPTNKNAQEERDAMDHRVLYNFTPEGMGRAGEFLTHERLALLAIEARGIMVDRNVPLLVELTTTSCGVGSEEEGRRMAERDPARFLELFAEAMAMTVVEWEEDGDGVLPDFSERRFGPPSLV